MTPQLKTAIKRKHRVYNKYVKRECEAEEWEHVKILSQNTSQMITSTKEKYFLKLGQKLSDPANGVKAYWPTLNKIIKREYSSTIIDKTSIELTKCCSSVYMLSKISL